MIQFSIKVHPIFFFFYSSTRISNEERAHHGFSAMPRACIWKLESTGDLLGVVFGRGSPTIAQYLIPFENMRRKHIGNPISHIVSIGR